MKVYCVMEFNVETNGSELKEIFTTKDKAMESAKYFAEKEVEGYSQTSSVIKDGETYLAIWCKEDEDTEFIGYSATIAIYYVVEKDVLEN